MKHRRLVGEWIDDPTLDAARHERALRGLARLNRASRAEKRLWSAIRPLLDGRSSAERPLRLLDVATGGGDLLRHLARRARQAGAPLDLAGCDCSDEAIRVAGRAAEREGAEVELFTHDALRDPLPTGYDLITACLFLHHLREEEAVRLLKRLAAAAEKAVLVYDLDRRRRNLPLVAAACFLLTTSEVVRTDGPRSIRAAWTIREAGELARRAGLEGARIERCWPCHFLLSWIRP